MTAVAPPASAEARAAIPQGAGRSGPVAWLAIPALVLFAAFAVLPLLGVLFLSFTHLGRHRRHPPGRPDQLAGGAEPTPGCCTRCG